MTLFFFLDSTPMLRPGIPLCLDISQNIELMQFLFWHAAVRDRQQALALDHSSMVDAALRLKSLPTPALRHGRQHVVHGSKTRRARRSAPKTRARIPQTRV